MEELQVVDDYSTLLGGSHDVSGIYEDCPSLLEAICYPRPVLDSDSPFQEGFFHDFVFSPYGQEEVCSADSFYEREQQPYNWRNWSSDIDPCFSISCFWDDDFFSYGNGTGNNGQGSGLVKTEDSFQGEEHIDGYVSPYENAEDDVSYDGNAWSGYESWFRYASEEDSSYYGRQEPNYAYGCSLDELGLCEGFLGYWPCLIQKHQMAYEA